MHTGNQVMKGKVRVTHKVIDDIDLQKYSY